MHLLLFLGSFLGLGSAMPTSSSGVQVAYFMSNRPKGNGIHALPVDANGMVSNGTYTSTAGLGDRAPSVVGLTDALSAQGSLQLCGNMLFAVNAGSNTMSMLAIDPENPLNLTLVGKPVDTLGDFPNTIAIEEKLGLACVGNTGTRSGIACFKWSSSGFESSGDTLRPLLLQPQQSTPPSGPFNTVSQIFFNEESTALYATVKGNPTTPTGGVGYFAYFPVSNGKVDYRGVTSSPRASEVLFGSVPLPNNRVFATDAAFGAVLLEISHDGVARTLKKSVIKDQSATCWAVYHTATKLIYVTDDGINQITSFDPETGVQVGRSMLDNGNPSMINIKSDGKYLYALSHGNSTIPPHVIVMETMHGGKVRAIQNYEPPSFAGIDIEGLALLRS